MAKLEKYKCKQCGYQLMASATPYVPAVEELYAQCYCKNCKKVFNIEAGTMYQVDVTKLQLRCETCGEPVTVWTPDMGCPQCGGAMKRDEEFSVFGV
jgi:Zn finger protein HypA/HybF involved in hydrogenase expression